MTQRNEFPKDTEPKAPGLNQFFSEDQLFHVGMVKNKKPAPDLFLLAAHSAKNNDTITVVEDSLTGVKAGIAAKFSHPGSSFLSFHYWFQII